MSSMRSGRPKARRLLMGAALVAALGGVAFGALPVYASAPAGATHAAPVPPPDPYAPAPYDEQTPGAEAPVEFAATSLKVPGTVGTALSATLTLTSDYDAPATFTVLDPAKLPPGVTIGADGTITGTPTKAGTFAVPVKACVDGDCATGTVTFTIKESVSSTWTLTVGYTGVVGQPASGTIKISGTPYCAEATYTVTDPSKLPPGITVAPDGTISGTPTKPGTYTFPVKVCVGSTCATIPTTITVSQPTAPDWPLNITYEGPVGQPAKGQITVTGTPDGTKVTYTVTDPSKLPPGITVGTDGSITGTPTKAGAYTFNVRICAGGQCVDKSITITVFAQSTQLEILLQGFNGVLNQPATGQVTATGVPTGTTVTYSVVDPGKLPPGITIGADGTVIGTPTAAGTYVVPIRVCLGTGCARTTITLVIGSSTNMVIVLKGFSGSVGQQVTGKYILEDAAGATFTVLDKTKLPPGVSVAANGTLSGIAQAKGTFTFPVKICLGTACGNTTLTITILADRGTYGTVTTTEVKVVIWGGQATTIALPGEYGQVFTVADGSSLPPGITLSADGVLTGRATTPGAYGTVLNVGSEIWKVVFVVGVKKPCPGDCP